jgi:hypothetical protein
MAMRTILASLVAVSSWAAAPIASAQPGTPTSVGVLPLDSQGDLGEDLQARLLVAITEGLARGSANVFTLDAHGGCESPECRESFDVDRDVIVSARIEASGRNFEIALELRRSGADSPIAEVDASCDICGFAEVEQTVADLAAELVPKLENLEPEPGILVVTGKPTRASLEIDGEPRGDTPFEDELAAGDHEIRISKPGYVTQEREWVAAPGVRETLSYQLNPERSGARSSIRPVWGWLSLGGGIALAGSGASMLALHGRPHRPSCASGEVDVNGRCPNMWETRGLGIGLAAGGAAAIGVGIGLLIHSYRKGKRSDEKPSVGLAPSGSGAVIGGSF